MLFVIVIIQSTVIIYNTISSVSNRNSIAEESEEVSNEYTYRELALLKKGMPLDSRRITLEEVKQIIASTNSFGEIMIKIDNIHGGYDYTQGSGVCTDYYLTEDGTFLTVLFERIKIDKYEEIVLFPAYSDESIN